MTEQFKLSVSAFWSPKVKQGVENGELAAVGITLYPPKKSFGYPLSGNLKELAPNHKLFKVDDVVAFREPFFELLESRWSQAEDRLLTLMAMNPDKDMSLLCFDRVDRPEDWCHRQIVAEFISKKWEMEVMEL